ncbi:LOW QUALITY PROTEIN: feather keratin Cos1-2-like [Chlamydotis macqueenii]
MSLSENYTSTEGARGPGAAQGCYKRQPSSLLSHPLLSTPSPWEPGEYMSCCNPCLPCQPCGPTPLANSCNEPCVRQCQNSTIVIQPSPVVVTLPGPILSSFPQNTVVGSSTSAAVGSILSCDGVPINSGCCDLSCITSRYCGSRCRPC